ncbi:tetratricopeptide repeat protein [Leptolyngbya cf. ectocarpi LEGE 11479]|uniref:Tetratricopeptide repeat protein n=1 Tax=Leptolyngbya cf. ectocarpi LEGE 11479 TaxID=1828722 RepID=A0A928ZPT7_LEPEC|nr:tetratricopeptide repeat protein [Leptolyngbya ectocarpi]MBE9065545.1 tetratricopeptide repeat protein [Leptolyngbya cf. ectocarpi LEGE 11479]
MTAAITLVGIPATQAQDTLDEQLRQPVNREAIYQQRDVADQLLRLGECQAAEADYQSALRAWGRAAELYYEIGDTAAIEQVYANIGRAHVQLGDYNSAEIAVRRQLAISRDNQNFNTQIFAWNALGTLRLQQGDISSATQAYQEALSIAQSIQDYEGIGLSLNNLGLLAAATGDYMAAIDYYETAGNYRIRTGNLIGRANTNNNLGDAYFADNQPDRALGAYLLGLSYSRDAGDATAQLQAIDGLIEIYSDRRDWSQVRSYLDERIALTLDTDNAWGRLITFKRLGEFYEATGEDTLAQEQYERAHELARLLDQTQLEVELFNRLLSFTDRQDSN